MNAKPLPNKRYGVILADPAWHFVVRSRKGEGRSAKKHYRVMSLAEIKALDVPSIAAPDCCLFLWAIDPMLPQAFDVIREWGFTFKTVGFHWTKTRKRAAMHKLSEQCDFPIGPGYWTRANPEQCLLATRGHPKRLHADVPRLIVSPRRQHSEKPDEIYGRIKRLVAGPYLEMFARQAWPGWDGWGDEYPGAGGTGKVGRL